MKHAASTGVVLIVIALCGLPMACKTTAEDAAAEDADFTGTYNLVSIEGNPIPYAPMHLGRRQPEVTSGTITLHDGGTFASTMEYADTSGKTMSRAFAGTYTVDGREFVLAWTGAGRTSVTIDGSTLTMNNEGMLFVYEK